MIVYRTLGKVGDYFRYSGQVRFQATAWELHRFEPVPDFRINEVNYSSELRLRAPKSEFALSFIEVKRRETCG